MKKLFDRSEKTKFIKDIDTKNRVKQALECFEKTYHTHQVVCTKFLSPTEIYLVDSILKNLSAVAYKCFGGYSDAERQIICFFPEYFRDIEILDEVAILEIIMGQNKDITHRDCLGAMISCGIARESIGDILICESCCYVVVKKPVDAILLNQLTRIKNFSVKVEEVSEIPAVLIEPEVFEVNIASWRMDAFIASVLRISREKSQNLVQMGAVKLNYQTIENKSQMIAVDSVVTIREYGKYKVLSLLSETKKGRLSIQIAKY